MKFTATDTSTSLKDLLETAGYTLTKGHHIREIIINNNGSNDIALEIEQDGQNDIVATLDDGFIVGAGLSLSLKAGSLNAIKCISSGDNEVRILINKI